MTPLTPLPLRPCGFSTSPFPIMLPFLPYLPNLPILSILSILTSSSTSHYLPPQDCTDALNFSLHELQVMRVEHRGVSFDTESTSSHSSSSSSSSSSPVLLLGNVHTDPRRRLRHRPNAYQPPLITFQVKSIYYFSRGIG